MGVLGSLLSDVYTDKTKNVLRGKQGGGPKGDCSADSRRCGDCPLGKFTSKKRILNRPVGTWSHKTPD